MPIKPHPLQSLAAEIDSARVRLQALNKHPRDAAIIEKAGQVVELMARLVDHELGLDGLSIDEAEIDVLDFTLSGSYREVDDLSADTARLLRLLDDVIPTVMLRSPRDEEVRQMREDFFELERQMNSMLLRDSAKRAAADAESVSRTKEQVEQAAGEVAEVELAKEFAAYGKRQEQVSWIWFALAILLLAASVTVALTLLNKVGTELDWYSIIGHGLIALPSLGLAAYCSRESSRHRELGQWARRLAVQLKSISAYSSRLDAEPRNALLTDFGKYVFGPHALGEDNQMQAVPPEIIKAIADVIKTRAA